MTNKPAFRRINKSPDGSWYAYSGVTLRAIFYYESDAIEWRANDPLNKGTIDELIDREEQRKDGEV